MEVKVLYFGMLAEILGQSAALELVEPGDTLFDLNKMVVSRNASLNEVSYSMAVNQTMVTDNVELTAGDEVSFFPPFAGG